jgi:hypothetical protein
MGFHGDSYSIWKRSSRIFLKQSKFKKQFLHISYKYVPMASAIHCAPLSYARFGKIVATAQNAPSRITRGVFI